VATRWDDTSKVPLHKQQQQSSQHAQSRTHHHHGKEEEEEEDGYSKASSSSHRARKGVKGASPLHQQHADRDRDRDREEHVTQEELIARQVRAPPVETSFEALRDLLRLAEARAAAAEVGCTTRQLRLDEVSAKWMAAQGKYEEEKALRYSRQGAREMVTTTASDESTVLVCACVCLCVLVCACVCLCVPICLTHSLAACSLSLGVCLCRRLEQVLPS